MFSGFSLLVFQLSLYPIVERAIGTVMVSRVAGVSAQQVQYFELISVAIKIPSGTILPLPFIFTACTCADFVNTPVDKLPLHCNAKRDHPFPGVKLRFPPEERSVCK